MKNLNFELVLFDADGTLFDYNLSEKIALSSVYNRFSIKESLETFISVYKEENSKVWAEFEDEKISAENLKTERFRRLFKRIHEDLNPKVVSDFYLDTLSNQHFLLDNAIKVIEKVKQFCKIVLITNGLTFVQRRRFQLSNFEKIFDAIIISEEIGYAKPGKEIFEIAMDSVKHYDKNSTLIVGDSIKSDIIGGINFGIKTCWFNQNGENLENGIYPDFIISDLLELIPIIFPVS